MNCFLTVDWDFFIFSPGEANIQGDTTNEDGERIKNFLLYDWSAHEKYGSAIGHIVWLHRASSFLAQKIDIEKELSIDPDTGCVPIDTFVKEILQRFNLTSAEAWYSDSHAWGLPMAIQAHDQGEEDLHAITFDAHCDLGYSEEKIKNEIEEGISDCGSWLFHAMREDIVSTAEIVYPDWKGLLEWKQIEKHSFIQPLLDRIEIKTWSDYLKERWEKPTKVSLLHLCRSSAWTPPWLDSSFMDLINHLAGIVQWGNLDDPDNPWKQVVGGYDSSVPREWDRNQVKEYADRILEFLSKKDN